MSFTTKAWIIKDNDLVEIQESNLHLESRLETWIERNPSILGLDIVVIGRQVKTEFGGTIDLLAIDQSGDLVVLELKRNRTPRDVIGQVLDYASWVRGLDFDGIDLIAQNYKNSSVADLYLKAFDDSLPENINVNHKLVIVASSLDDSTERIVQYLYEEHKININAIFFNIFVIGDREVLARSWINDPEDVEEESRKTKSAPWSGYLFVNTGITDDNDRHWEYNLEYSFVSAGGGQKWIVAIRKLKHGDKIFAYIKGKGYVGFGVVEDEAVPLKEYKVNGEAFHEGLPKDSKLGGDRDNLDKTEWLARVNWVKTFSEDQAKTFKGIFANQNVVCKLRDKATIDFVKHEFNVE